MKFAIGDCVVKGYGRYKFFGTVEHVINDFYMDVRWEDGDLETAVFHTDIRRVEGA